MTLNYYKPAELDGMTLRLFDLAAQLRRMSEKCREVQLDQVPLHDKKALEWLVKLEEWALRTEQDVDLAVRRQQGVRRAQQLREQSSGESA